jgi:predicted metal-binding membrane protein
MATDEVQDESRAPEIQDVSMIPPRAPRRAPLRRAALVLGLLAMAMLAWGYLAVHALKLVPPDIPWLAGTALMRHPVHPYQPGQLQLLLAMWSAVMAAVMLPACAPLIVLFSNVSRLHHLVRFPFLATVLFVLANLVAWVGFAALATLAQWGLHEAGALDAGGALANSTATGLALVAAGAYQWTSLKHASLDHCRSPLSFVLTGWHPGAWGAFRMGFGHGLQCIGCCWALLLLLLAAGVMNLAAIAALTVLVTAEKLLPRGVVLACVGGLILVAWGTYVLFP